jgi:hypothetical protein
MMIQIQNLIPLFINLIAPAAIIISLMFLPAIIELKKPRDAGPRLITPSSSQRLSGLRILTDAEEKFISPLTLKTSFFPIGISNIEA